MPHFLSRILRFGYEDGCTWGAKPLNDELSALPVNAPPRLSRGKSPNAAGKRFSRNSPGVSVGFTQSPLPAFSGACLTVSGEGARLVNWRFGPRIALAVF